MKLFDFLFGKAIDRRIAAYQNDLITKHCDEVNHIYRTMRGWRHDYHNHIQAMLAMTDNPEDLRKYLWMLNNDLTTVDTVLKTGNVMVDAILNSKLSLIKSKNIAVNAKATVPTELRISESIYVLSSAICWTMQWRLACVKAKEKNALYGSISVF